MSNKLQDEVIDSIEWQVSSKKDKKTRNTQYVKWIIATYLKYAWVAFFNGYPIRILDGANIFLYKEPVRNLDKKEEGIYFTSNRVFGYMFSISIEGRFHDPGYRFYPGPHLAKRLQETLDSDIIYELIKS